MALIHQAELRPSKIELISAWIPSQPWVGDADVSSLEAVGAYRFDDPDGEVGIETHLLRTAVGRVMQVPLTYRGAPLAGGDGSLVGTMEHSVLGERWVYDACGDPVYAQALARVILTGGRQADLDIASDGAPQRREPTTRVFGSGAADVAVPAPAAVTFASDHAATIILTGDLELVVRRMFDREVSTVGAHTLRGSWPGTDEATILALARTGAHG